MINFEKMSESEAESSACSLSKSSRAARLIAEPVLDEGWQIEYSVHHLSPVLCSDVKSVFRNEMDRELQKLGISPEMERSFLMERLLGIPTWQPGPTWDQAVNGEWNSFQLDLSAYPSQVIRSPVTDCIESNL